jgi:hypothetical protein
VASHRPACNDRPSRRSLRHASPLPAAKSTEDVRCAAGTIASDELAANPDLADDDAAGTRLTTTHVSHRSGRLLTSTSEVLLPQPTLTGRFVDAVRYAADAHGDQVRKGTEVPYVSHPLAVAALVLEYGGDDVQATAALLHDVVEDCGGLPRLHDVRSTFGEEVAGLVAALSDSITEEGQPKEDWRSRKVAYLRHLGELVVAEHPAALVSLCDKLHNARAIVADAMDPEGPGAAVWDRFTASAQETAWYYQQLAAIFADSRLPGRAVRAFTEEARDLAAQAATASDRLGR